MGGYIASVAFCIPIDEVEVDDEEDIGSGPTSPSHTSCPSPISGHAHTDTDDDKPRRPRIPLSAKDALREIHREIRFFDFRYDELQEFLKSPAGQYFRSQLVDGASASCTGAGALRADLQECIRKDFGAVPEVHREVRCILQGIEHVLAVMGKDACFRFIKTSRPINVAKKSCSLEEELLSTVGEGDDDVSPSASAFRSINSDLLPSVGADADTDAGGGAEAGSGCVSVDDGAGDEIVDTLGCLAGRNHRGSIGGASSSSSHRRVSDHADACDYESVGVTQEELDNFYPFLLVNVKAGVAFHYVESAYRSVRVGGSTIGGGTFMGLSRMLCESAHLPADAVKMGVRGDNSKVDMLVGDIYGGDYQSVGLAGNVIASSFGNCQKNVPDDVNEYDISRSLLTMFAFNITQLAYFNALIHGCSKLVFTGYYLEHPEFLAAIQHSLSFWSNGMCFAYFFRHAKYLGCIGALKRSFRSNSNYWNANIDSMADTFAGSNWVEEEDVAHLKDSLHEYTPVFSTLPECDAESDTSDEKDTAVGGRQQTETQPQSDAAPIFITPARVSDEGVTRPPHTTTTFDTKRIESDPNLSLHYSTPSTLYGSNGSARPSSSSSHITHTNTHHEAVELPLSSRHRRGRRKAIECREPLTLPRLTPIDTSSQATSLLLPRRPNPGGGLGLRRSASASRLRVTIPRRTLSPSVGPTSPASQGQQTPGSPPTPSDPSDFPLPSGPQAYLLAAVACAARRSGKHLGGNGGLSSLPATHPAWGLLKLTHREGGDGETQLDLSHCDGCDRDGCAIRKATVRHLQQQQQGEEGQGAASNSSSRRGDTPLSSRDAWPSSPRPHCDVGFEQSGPGDVLRPPE